VHLFILVREDGRVSSDHLVHDLSHTDHLVLVVDYRHAQYAGRVVTGLLVHYLIEPRILCTHRSSFHHAERAELGLMWQENERSIMARVEN